MKKGLIVLLIAIVFFVIAFLIYSQVFSRETRDEPNIDSEEENQPIPLPKPNGSQNYNIEISDFAFSPETLNIKKGDSVTWSNKDDVRHTATSDEGVFDSNLLAKGQSFRYDFNEVGTFSYHCTPPPYMKAKIVVQ